MTTNAIQGQVQKTLDQLRDCPTGELAETTLKLIFDFIIGASNGDNFHWFCGKANTTTVAAATFLLRLHAYESANVVTWRARLGKCLSGCMECVHLLEKAKLVSRTTYLSAYPEDTRIQFFESFEEYEARVVLEELKKAGLEADHPSSKSLSDVPVALAYRMLSSFGVFQHPQILSILDQHPPSSPMQWPFHLLPAGIILLLLHRNQLVRGWASHQVAKCSAIPLPNDSFNGPYAAALNAIASIFSVHSSSTTTVNAKVSHILNSVVSDRIVLWSSLANALKLIPPESLISGQFQDVDIRRVVIGHLHDAGPEWPEIMRCFDILIKRLGARIWLGEGPEFPLVIFDSIKDNPQFINRIHETGGNRRSIIWFIEYLSLIHDPSIHSQVCLKMLGLLCEELQHERFSDCRPPLISFAATILKSERSPERQGVIADAFRIHGEVLASVAFSSTHSSPPWLDARAQTRELFLSVMVQDVKYLSSALKGLCKSLADKRPPSASCPEIRTHIWQTAYRCLQNESSDGICSAINAMSQAAHLDSTMPRGFKSILTTPVAQKLFDDIQTGLTALKAGFLDCVLIYTERSTPGDVVALLQTPATVKQVLKLLLSPVEDLQKAARAFLGLAYDADVRVDCFRALLIHHTDACMEGFFEFLTQFKDFAYSVPEACSLAKALIRGFADVLEVLCSQPKGLLYQASFVKPSDKPSPSLHLPKLWTLMTQAVSLVFKRVPDWSTYFENESMLDWMRDTLIFGQEMLSELRSFQSAAQNVTGLSVTQGRKIRQDMLDDVQRLLPEVARWLRLTDEELLHQSFSLLESLFVCFRDNKVHPNVDGISRLKRFLANAKVPDTQARRSRLSADKLQRLEVLVSSFEEEDGDVEIVEATSELIIISDNDDELPPPKLAKAGKAKETKIAASATTKPSTIPKPTTQRGSEAKTIPRKPAIVVQSNKEYFGDADQAQLDRANASARIRKPATKPKPSGSSSKKKDISSDSESSSEASDDEDQTSVLKKMANKSPKIKKAPPRRQIQQIEIATARNTMGEREKAMRMQAQQEAYRASKRRTPNFNNLFRTLLTWNYDHNENTPPGPPLRTTRVPDRFDDFLHYAKVFEPLLLHELWSQIYSSKENVAASYDCRITTKTTSDTGVDTDVSINEILPKNWYLSESDIVLLRNPAERSRCALARVISSRTNKPPSPGLTATIRFYFDENRPDPGIQIMSTWSLAKVFSLSTVLREYAALNTAQFYECRDVILKPRLGTPPFIDPSAIRRTMETYQVNEPQSRAIESALGTEGFVLIQGPPGTGKTSTICGLVTAATTRRAKPVSLPSNTQSTPTLFKVLVCAPSNAAIDEITFRLKEGYRGSVKCADPLKVVRLGSAIGESVQDVALANLVGAAMGAGDLDDVKEHEMKCSALQREVNSASATITEKKAEMDGIRDNAARRASLQEELNVLYIRRRKLGQELDVLHDMKRAASRTNDTVRRRMEGQVLNSADVICTTLSGAGHAILQQHGLEFDVIIIDEAAQAIELSALIPLRFPCKRCILVGDPNQLPPTVTSAQATRQLYNQSLFVRLQKGQPKAVHLLSIQYRMHPEISVLPSRLFYNGALTDGPDLATKTAKPWHNDSKFGVYKVFSVAGNQESAPGKSMKNRTEAQMVLTLYHRLQVAYGRQIKVGVIAPYRGQVNELRGIFAVRYGGEILENVVFNTVDGFQGQEKDIIILSTVRAGPGVQSIGFLNDVRRMNVALTRAKSSVFIVGNMPTLERSDEMWKTIIDDARGRGLFVEASNTYFTESSSSRLLSTPVKAPTGSASKPTTSKVDASIPPPPPIELSTPKALAESVAEGSRVVSGIKRKLADLAEDMSDERSNTHKPPPPTLESRKRPENAPPPNPPIVRPPGLPPKPKPPKKKEPTLFIPKKNPNGKKRPPDGDSGAGPSNRQRLG